MEIILIIIWTVGLLVMIYTSRKMLNKEIRRGQIRYMTRSAAPIQLEILKAAFIRLSRAINESAFSIKELGKVRIYKNRSK